MLLSGRAPVRIRRNVEDFGDPYADQESLEDYTICSECASVHASGRWYPEGHFSSKELSNHKCQVVSCPACRRLRDHVPGGVIKLTGSFIADHRDEMLNLVRNEAGKATGANPLERVMSLEVSNDGEIEITTTSDKLAQKIGRAIHRAFDGSVVYKWAGNARIVRVNWHRDL